MLAPFRDYGMIAAVWGFQAEAGTHAIRLIMSGALDRHPELKIVLGHLGEGLPFWLWRLDNIHEKTYRWAGDQLAMARLELKPSEYIRRNFTLTTSGMFDQEVFDYTLAKVGPERLMFAVDYPYEDSHVATDFLNGLKLSQQDRALLSQANAERLFDLSIAGIVRWRTGQDRLRGGRRHAGRRCWQSWPGGGSEEATAVAAAEGRRGHQHRVVLRPGLRLRHHPVVASPAG
jgi:hypothetical protein